MTDKMTDKMISIYNINQISNEKVELYEEEGKYFLRIDFDYEDDYGYFKGHIERIEFNFRLIGIIQENDDWHNFKPRTEVFADLGLDKRLHILPDGDKYFTLTLVKEKIYDMTVEEIEKKLGRKIRIVGEKSS